MHLVGFIIEIYYDARFHKHQIYCLTFGLPDDHLIKIGICSTSNVFTVGLRTNSGHLFGCNKIVYQIIHRLNNNIKKFHNLKFNYSYKQDEATKKVN